MQLSKSDYMLFLKHPAWLWLKKHDKAKLPLVDDDTQAIFDAGHLFESYAEALYPDVVRLGFDGYEEYLTLPLRTQNALADGHQVISQAGFTAGYLTCICDLLVRVSENTFDLYEIKTSTRAKMEHEYDLAFQLIVLEDAGLEIRNISVIHVNKDYVRDGEVDPHGITAITDVTKAVKEKREKTRKAVAKALKVVASAEMPDLSPTLASRYYLRDWLPIYKTLVAQEEESIYHLTSPTLAHLKSLEKQEIKRLSEIPEGFPLTDKQRLQVLATKLKEEIINKEEIEKFLSKLVFPLYFLDYETFAGAVPAFDGLSPYQQIPFQYSLHVLDSPESPVKHFSYLHKENSNPALPLTLSLKEHIGSSGSIVVWNQGFETRCNEIMGELVPAFSGFYKKLNKRIVDLMIPFYNSWYVHKDFKGSASLKNVLPVLIPDLAYSDLDIAGGAAAQRIWMETVLDGKREEEKEKVFADLDKYCGRDTLAMVEIYKKLSQIAAKREEEKAPA